MTKWSNHQDPAFICNRGRMAPTQAEENSNAAVPEEGCLGQEKTHLVNKRQGGVKQ